MPILTSETEPKRGRRSWIPAVLAGVPLLLLVAVSLWALLVPLDEAVVIPLGGRNGPVLVGVDMQPPPALGVRPRWHAFAYKQKPRNGVAWDVYGVSLRYRMWCVMQPRR